MKNQTLVTIALMWLHPFVFGRYGKKVLYIPMVPLGGYPNKIAPNFQLFYLQFCWYEWGMNQLEFQLFAYMVTTCIVVSWSW
jgi:hypothetical protein